MAMGRRASDYYISQQTGFALLVMVAKIACIDLSIEALIMQVLSFTNAEKLGSIVNFLDPLTLTLLSSPLTYVWVVRPFARAAREAHAARGDDPDQRPNEADGAHQDEGAAPAGGRGEHGQDQRGHDRAKVR